MEKEINAAFQNLTTFRNETCQMANELLDEEEPTLAEKFGSISKETQKIIESLADVKNRIKDLKAASI